MTDDTLGNDPLDELVAECLRRQSIEGDNALDALCAEHPDAAEALRRRMRSLAQIGLAEVPTSDLPVTVGPYRILRRLGEGGMGTVLLAEQLAPIRRQVAIKRIRAGLDGGAVLRRFERERQALAAMSHDSIARVFDVGTDDRGQPWFAMEYVPGEPITDYCDRKALPLAARIELFLQVCNAVQHAHHKGVVHRDLKPNNVLVIDGDDGPQAKVIDFGLARAVNSAALQESMVTEAGWVLGTPEYMAPEQAGATDQDVDTRADVYSLGVILHELLVGRLPFLSEELRSKGLLAMQRLICEIEPPLPSEAFRSLGRRMAAAANLRGLDARSLQRVLSRDLDWVLSRTMQKDRTRRYATPQELAADLRRYLSDEPVEAGPPSQLYRLRKFIRRRRGTAAALSLLIVGAVAANAYAAHKATQATTWATITVTNVIKHTALGLRPPQYELERHAADDTQPGLLVELSPSQADSVMTTLESLVHFAREECLQELRVTLAGVLRDRFGDTARPFLGRISETPCTLAGQHTLHRWMRRAATATTIDEVFAGD